MHISRFKNIRFNFYVFFRFTFIVSVGRYSFFNKEIFDRAELTKEKDNKLLKEKIIEDQSKTIGQLQHQVKEKTNDLNKALEENTLAEEKIIKVNSFLEQKHMELENESNEKNRLAHKLRVSLIFIFTIIFFVTFYHN